MNTHTIAGTTFTVGHYVEIRWADDTVESFDVEGFTDDNGLDLRAKSGDIETWYWDAARSRWVDGSDEGRTADRIGA